MKKKSVRLPVYITPIKYVLHIHTSFETHIFTGEETVEINIAKSIKKIVLHSVGLNITKAIVSHGEDTQSADIHYDTETETVILTFKKSLAIGTASLFVEFNGTLSDSLAGFYKSTYLENGVTKTIATTQFEATDARRAFPCFDEPDKKAVFDIALSIPKGKTAISNTLVTKKVIHSKTHNTHYFSSTPKMSTYLLAFIIGEFEYVEKNTKRGVKVRVYTTVGKKAQGAFALSCAVRSIDFYESYFGIEYPLQALDMIAIPDFAAGAMENWGAVTYRETALLFDEQNSSLAAKQYIAIVVAHELAHQWFGNLVTMSWWTDLWLNEGFASYMEYLCVNELFPEWHIWEQFVSDNVGGALTLDALKSTHPVEVTVHHPDEINEVFDAISYEKGASIIRMLAEYLGEKTFQKGVQNYLKTHAYKNTVTTDLWKSFEKVSKKPITKMMGVWTKTAGHPVLEVTEKNSKTVCVCQKRFFSSPIEKKQEEKTIEKTIWPIPFSFADATGAHTTVLTKKKSELKSEGFVIGNVRQTGIYRIVYDEHISRRICASIQKGELSSEDRLGFIRDVHGSVLNCDMSMKEVFAVLDIFKSEKEYIVWVQILDLLTHIRFVYQGSIWIDRFEIYIQEFAQQIHTELGYAKKEGERHNTTLLRSLILGLLVSTYDTKVIAKGLKLYAQKHIDPNMRNFVYASVCKGGTQKDIESLSREYIATHMSEEKNRIARARIGTSNKAQFKKTLTWILSSEIRSQDVPLYLAQSLYNRFNKDIALEFVLSKWEYLLKKYSGDKYTRSRIIGALDSFDTAEAKKKIAIFFKSNSYVGAERTLAQSLEQIEANIYFKKYHAKQLEKIFTNE